MNNSYDVIIVNYNTAKIIRPCLDSILESEIPPSKIIIYDNSSRDESPDIIEKEYPDCLLVRGEKNIGFGRANNVGIGLAKSKYIFFANPDLLLEKDCTKKLIEALEREVGAVISCPLVYQGWKKTRDKINSFGSIINTQGFTFNVENAELFRLGNCFHGAAFMADSDFIKKNMFEPSYFLYYEEPELCVRLLKQKKKIVRNEQAVCYHLEGYATSSSQMMNGLCFRQYYAIQNRHFALGKHWPMRLMPKALIFNFFHLWYFEFQFIKSKNYKYLDLPIRALVRFVQGLLQRKGKCIDKKWYLHLANTNVKQALKVKQRVFAE